MFFPTDVGRKKTQMKHYEKVEENDDRRLSSCVWVEHGSSWASSPGLLGVKLFHMVRAGIAVHPSSSGSLHILDYTRFLYEVKQYSFFYLRLKGSFI